jgi:hypothetical protein
MSKLAAVAERLAQTRRWLDQEADRIAARLDQLEKRAPAAIQNAHRILDEQQRDLDATEQMVQQWLSATADLSAASKPRAAQHAGTSPLTRAQPRQTGDLAPGQPEPAHHFLDEQQKDVGRLERALQTLATEVPEPQAPGVSQPAGAQPMPPNEAAASGPDSRRLLDEQQKDEGGLERALQTLANKLQAPQPAGASAPARPRLLDELQLKSDDKPAARKLGVVRVA